MTSTSAAARAACLAAALCAGASAAVAAEPASEADKARALEIYKTIVEMRTSKGEGEVPAMADYLAGLFRDAGFPAEDVEVIPSDETAALVVRYRGDGTSGKKPILFLGHMDVVGANPEDWELDPFALTEKDGYFFGRGTIDNKYGITNLTQTFLRLKESGFTPDRDLVIALSGDEETGMTTTRMLAEKLKGAEYALNSDAGGGALTEDGDALVYSVQAAEKTYATYEITARNPGGHSSRPRSDNAIYDLTAALRAIEAHQFPVTANDLTRGFLGATGRSMGGELGAALVAFAEDPTDEDAAARLAEEPAFVGMTRTTCVATMLRAGHAENALPQSATATVNCRIFPGVSVADVKATLAEVIDNDELEIEVLGEPTESPVSETREDVMAAVAKAVHARYPDVPLLPYMESGGTDGMHFRKAGVPTWAISGAFMNENDMYAHGLNERMPVKSFYDGLDHWTIIIEALAGGGES